MTQNNSISSKWHETHKSSGGGSAGGVDCDSDDVDPIFIQISFFFSKTKNEVQPQEINH